MITNRLLSAADSFAVYECFLEAFSDYQVDMRISQQQFEQRISRDGVKLEISAGAFDETPSSRDSCRSRFPAARRSSAFMTSQLRKTAAVSLAQHAQPSIADMQVGPLRSPRNHQHHP